MSPNLLILGGTTEARRLADAVAQAGLRGIVSYAGRVERPYPVALPHRIGGFGGVDGLSDHLRAEKITHVIDATHPFAAQMSRNAVAACAATGVSLAAFTRPPWQQGPGENWQCVPDIAGAVDALAVPAKRVMLAVGRMHLAEFAPNPQHFYLLRLVDAPGTALPFPDCRVEVSRGPFTESGDRALMERHGIDLVVSKNAGGSGARAKLDAARALGLPVIMIDRPALPDRTELHSVQQVLDWVAHSGVNLGV